VNKGKEVPSQPDFVLHVGKKTPAWADEEPPTWADVELLFEHTRSSREAVTKKFLQWLRGAWSVFHHQPFRRHFYGIMFIKPCAYICYADHGCAVYSEPLDFVKNKQHTKFLIYFLSGFIADPKHRGRDPTIKKENNKVYIRHAKERWVELRDSLLCYRPCLVGRNIRVALVEYKGDNFPELRVVMKSTWEEKLPLKSSPPPEVEVLQILLKAKVRGLPQPYYLDSAIVRDDSNLEVETRSFPQNCKVALSVSTDDGMVKMQSGYVSSHPLKLLSVGEPFLRNVKVQRRKFNEPLEIRRRLTRIIMSYCEPLKEAMRNGTPNRLMRIIRDAMIVYYEAYKLPESGFIHGGKHFTNLSACYVLINNLFKQTSPLRTSWFLNLAVNSLEALRIRIGAAQ
jgi:Fungal protein kinase